MTIGVWSYETVLREERDATIAVIETVLRSGQLILGEQVALFESRFSAFCKLPHGIGVNSGTDALFLGLKALGIGAGDEVITVANTAVPTVAAIAATGAQARFVDIDPDTYLMDVSLLDAAITQKTRCILVVHLYGQCVDMTAVRNIARLRGLRVLEDCAQAHGARQGDAMAGSMSDLAAFSFYPTKILGGYGDGGMVATASESLAERVRRLRFYGMKDRYYSEELGYNSRLDELQAAILNMKLDRLQTYLDRRHAIAERYASALADTLLTLPATARGNRHAYYLYVVRHRHRDTIMQRLRGDGIALNISYPWPVHTMRGFENLGYKAGDLPQTEQIANEIFSLPMYPGLDVSTQNRVIAALKSCLSDLEGDG